MVADRIRRDMEDDTNYVKKRLNEQIEKLKLQKVHLENQFRDYIHVLESGDKMDKYMRDEVHSAIGVQKLISGELNNQIQFLTRNLNEVAKANGDAVRHGNFMKASRISSMQGFDGVTQSAVNLAALAHRCSSCLAKLDVRNYYESFPNTFSQAEFRVKVNQLKESAVGKANGNSQLIGEIESCAGFLLGPNGKDACENTQKTQQALDADPVVQQIKECRSKSAAECQNFANCVFDEFNNQLYPSGYKFKYPNVLIFGFLLLEFV